MSPARFREIVGMPGDAVPLAPQLAAVPFWTNAVVSNVMTYAQARCFGRNDANRPHGGRQNMSSLSCSPNFTTSR